MLMIGPSSKICRCFFLQHGQFDGAQACASGLVDYHLVLDLLPALASAFLSCKLPGMLAAGQAAAIWLCLNVSPPRHMQCMQLGCIRLQAYASGLVDYHLVMDLLPALASAFFSRKLPATLSAGQAAILLCLGLQQLELADVSKALDLPTPQVLALFGKVCACLAPDWPGSS